MDPLGANNLIMRNPTLSRSPLWYLVMQPEEFLQWQQNPSWICARAYGQFRMVDSPTAIAVGIWFTLAWNGYPEQLEDAEVGEGQVILKANRILLMHEDEVVRPGYVVWVLDVDSGQEQFLALAESERSPVVRGWEAEYPQDSRVDLIPELSKAAPPKEPAASPPKTSGPPCAGSGGATTSHDNISTPVIKPPPVKRPPTLSPSTSQPQQLPILPKPKQPQPKQAPPALPRKAPPTVPKHGL